MARNKFGGTNADGVFTRVGGLLALAPAQTLTMWTAETGGVQVTDLLDKDGLAVTTIRTEPGHVPVFYGPDDVTELWADDGDTQRALMPARLPERLAEATLNTAFGRADTTFVPSARFMAAVGSPAHVAVNATARWLMDAAAVEQVVVTFGRGDLPRQWTQFDVYAVWVNEAATTGDAVIRADYTAPSGDGAVLPAPVNVGAPVLIAPAVARQVAIDKINTSPLAAPDDLAACTLLISRRASDAADTLANDIGLLGVMLGKA